MEKPKLTISLLLFFICATAVIKAQTITAVWRGKINLQKVEAKIVLEGADLTGTTCYYESPSIYMRCRVKGFFNYHTKELVWWDDQWIEEKGHGPSGANTATTYFNCPGYGHLRLGAKASDVQLQRVREASLNNTDWSNFTDEWDFVLESLTVEDNSPRIVDSSSVAAANKTNEHHPAKLSSGGDSVLAIAKPMPAQIELIKSTMTALPAGSIKPSGIQEKYTARKKIFAAQIPVSGDSIELHFYDNGQVDGDSISLFLNDKLIFEHIRLTDKAYSIKLSVRELNSSNELIMVAENLGSIPPNTAYMVATVDDKTYEARLESTEGSSALVLLVKFTDEQ